MIFLLKLFCISMDSNYLLLTVFYNLTSTFFFFFNVKWPNQWNARQAQVHSPMELNNRRRGSLENTQHLAGRTFGNLLPLSKSLTIFPKKVFVYSFVTLLSDC